MSALVNHLYLRRGLPALLVAVRLATVVTLGAILAGSTLFISHLENRGALSEAEDVTLTLASVALCAVLALMIGRGIITPMAERQNTILLEALERERTARAELERQLHAQQAFIEQANHHLRTPVTVIYGMTQLLAARGDDLEAGTRSDLRTVVLNHAGRLKGIVEDLSEFLDERVAEATDGPRDL